MTESSDSAEFDIEAEWAEARTSAGLPATPFEGERSTFWVFPVLLLYSGFFFGPFVTLLLGVVVLKGHISIRQAAFLTGIAGVTWCLIQGLSIYFGPTWTEYELQFLRSGLNFVNGIVHYLALRASARARYDIGRATIIITSVVVLVAAGLFFLIPSDILIAMGR